MILLYKYTVYIFSSFGIALFVRTGLSFVRPARTYSNGCKSPSRPDSGKATAESKGVHCEVESEGSFRQTSDPTYRNLISRLMRVDKSAEQDKVP